MDIIERDKLRIEYEGKTYEITGSGSIVIDSEISETSENAVQNKVIKNFIDEEVTALDNKIKDLELYKTPNATIIGSPTINNGQIRGFNSTNYLMFPFVVDVKDRPFEINIEITTSSNVATQENIFDSDFGFALAIRNSRFVVAMSSDGQTWDIGESVGTNVVFPNTNYKIKITWDLTTYKVQLSTNGGELWVDDITKQVDLGLYPKQIYIGVGTNHGQVLNNFTGIINFNNCNLIINNLLIWQGMDSVGIASRLATDLSNVDSVGEQRIKQIAASGSGVNISKKTGNKISEEPDGIYCDSITEDELTPIDGNIPTDTQMQEFLDDISANYVKVEELTELDPSILPITYEITEVEMPTNKFFLGKRIYAKAILNTTIFTIPKNGLAITALLLEEAERLISASVITTGGLNFSVPLASGLNNGSITLRAYDEEGYRMENGYYLYVEYTKKS